MWILLTSRERNESSWFHKLALLIQKVAWVESERRLPLVLVEEHRCQIGNYHNSLVMGIIIINAISHNCIWLLLS